MPVFNQRSCLLQCLEDLAVQELVPQLAFEASQ